MGGVRILAMGGSACENAAVSTPIITPDGRYIVVRGRLWRRANPSLPETEHNRLVAALMDARRSVAAARRTGHDV